MEEKNEIHLEKKGNNSQRKVKTETRFFICTVMSLRAVFGLLVPYKNSDLVAKPPLDLQKHRLSLYTVVRTVHESGS